MPPFAAKAIVLVCPLANRSHNSAVPNSLFARLLIASLMLLVLFFGLVYYAVDRAYISNTYDAKWEQLQLQNYVLLSAATVNDNAIAMPDELREPRFDEDQSGLYGVIHDRNGKVLWRSYSARALVLPATMTAMGKAAPGHSEFTHSNDYYLSHYTVEWEIIDDVPQIITFTVLEDSAPILAKITLFQHSILQLLTIGALALMAALLIVLRWGTLPLSRLARDIKAIENGQQQHLQGNYPVELQGLSRNLNALIDTEQQQRERYQNTLADLAHSLKTPLAVIRVELETGSQDQSHSLIAQQSQHMEDIITHQLQRAVIAVPNTLSERVPVAPVVAQLSNALSKVYADKAIEIEQQVDAAAHFLGDKRDLMEVLGNIADNACKACRRKVSICADLHQGLLRLQIHDDGAGIDESARAGVVQRGQRLDQKAPGQGIGLDVVNDIVSSYQGQLNITESPLGGALFTLLLPT